MGDGRGRVRREAAPAGRGTRGRRAAARARAPPSSQRRSFAARVPVDAVDQRQQVEQHHQAARASDHLEAARPVRGEMREQQAVGQAPDGTAAERVRRQVAADVVQGERRVRPERAVRRHQRAVHLDDHAGAWLAVRDRVVMTAVVVDVGFARPAGSRARAARPRPRRPPRAPPSRRRRASDAGAARGTARARARCPSGGSTDRPRPRHASISATVAADWSSATIRAARSAPRIASASAPPPRTNGAHVRASTGARPDSIAQARRAGGIDPPGSPSARCDRPRRDRAAEGAPPTGILARG